METNNHTPITGTPQIKTAINTVLGELDASISALGLFTDALIGHTATGSSAGDTTATTWVTRPLTGLETDPDNIVSISSNQFTPSSGTYVLVGWFSTYDSARTRLRLYNVTGTSVVQYGISHAVLSDQPALPLFAVFSANGTDAYRFEQYASANKTGGMGLGPVDWTDQNYAQVMMIKIGV